MFEGNSCSAFDYGKERKNIPVNDDPFDPQRDIAGRSTGGSDTSFTIPKLGITMDAGPAIAELEPERNIFISHADNDHFDGLKALMCMSVKRDKPYEVYISEKARQEVDAVKKEMATNEGIKVNFHFVNAGEEAKIDDDTAYEFFDLVHSPSSVGISVKKRNEESGEWERELTYTGDISIKKSRAEGLLKESPQLWDAKTLVVECSMPTSMEWMAPVVDFKNGNHSTISDVEWLIKGKENESKVKIRNLVLVHTFGLPEIPILHIGCNALEKDYERRLASNAFKTYYLASCLNGLKVSDEIKSPVLV